MEVCAQLAAAFVGSLAVVGGQSDKQPASATNSVPSSAPADIASKGLAIIAQRRESSGASDKTTFVSQADSGPACALLWVRNRRVTHQQCPHRIIREAKCHPVEIQSYICVDWASIAALRALGHERCRFGPHQYCWHRALNDNPRVSGTLSATAPDQGTQQHQPAARSGSITGLFSLLFSRNGTLHLCVIHANLVCA